MSSIKAAKAISGYFNRKKSDEPEDRDTAETVDSEGETFGERIARKLKARKAAMQTDRPADINGKY